MKSNNLKKVARVYLLESARSALAYALFLLISGLLTLLFMTGCISLANELNIERQPFYIAAAALLPFSFYSIHRAFELHDGEAQSAFPFESVKEYGFFSGLKILFSTPTLRRKLLVRLAVVNLSVIILPYSIGFRFLVSAIYPTLEVSSTTAELVSAAIACPVLSVLLILASTSAHKWWVIAPTGEREKILGARSHALRLCFELIKITVVYALAFPVLPAVFMLILSTVLTFGVFTVWIWVAVFTAILLTFVFRALSAISVRLRFLKRLKCAAAAEGYVLSKIQRPILSVFIPDKDEDFTLTKDGKSYSCKLVGFSHRSRPVFISPSGVITQKHTVSFLKMTFFHVMQDTRYELSGERKIVILTPMPKKVYINYGRTDTAPDDGDGGTTPSYFAVASVAKGGGIKHARATDRSIHGPGYISDVDRGVIKPFETGERVGDVKFFTPSGFISAIDNDCLDR